MPAFSPMPDAEAVCIAALKAADVADGRAYAKLPADWGAPSLKVERVGGVPVDRRRLDGARVQVAAYGDTKAEAYDTASAARIALLEMEGTAFADLNAYVTGVEDNLGVQWIPDPTTIRDRYVFAVVVYAHHYEAS